MRLGTFLTATAALAVVSAGAGWLAAEQFGTATDASIHVHDAAGAVPQFNPTKDKTRRDALPIEISVGDEFKLTDQDGLRRDRLFFAEGPTLVFFGYASCEGICLTAIPRLAEAEALLRERGARVRPVIVTIDPARDSPEVMKLALMEHSDRLIGLTGSEAELATVRSMFGVRHSLVSAEPENAVYQHGSFMFLLDANARLMTVLPPILGPGQIADIVEGYLASGCSDPDALNNPNTSSAALEGATVPARTAASNS